MGLQRLLIRPVRRGKLVFLVDGRIDDGWMDGVCCFSIPTYLID